MSRSQRHKIIVQGTDSAGKGLSEKQPALRYVNQYANSQAFSVWFGPAGGPLQGSSMVGFPPTLIPPPSQMAAYDAELTPAAGGFSDPGQFDNTGNPIYQSLPESNVPNPTLPAPQLNSINPNNAAVGDPPQPVNVNGSNFVDGSAVTFDGVDQPTTFLNNDQLQVTVPTSASPVAIAIAVRNPDGQVTATAKVFTIGAPRTFPIGPVNLASISMGSNGLVVTPAGAIDIRVGDTVLLEATFDGNVNGSWTVVSVNPIVIANNYSLPATIDGKGRISVTAGT
jgi:hypothetical protein